MQLLCKVGNKYPIGHPSYLSGWKDGQLIEMRPNGTPIGMREKKAFCIIETPIDYWEARGSIDWKSTADKVMNFKKLLCVPDSNGRYKWENFFNEEENLKKRDRFVDFKYLLDNGFITQGDFDSIYDKDRDHNNIYLGQAMDNYLFHEDLKQRQISPYSSNLGTIASGTFSIGSGLNYGTVTLFEADIAATLTGNLTGEHANEETSISTDVTFEIDTAGFLFKLTAASGAEHNGTAYGNGARIIMTLSDSLTFDEASPGTFDDMEVSKLAFDCTGNGNKGFRLVDGGDNGLWTINRMLIAGAAGSEQGIFIGGTVKSAIFTNNIIYGFGNGTGEGGIRIVNVGSGTLEVYNNSVDGCYDGIIQDFATTVSGTLIVKNNLVQGSGNQDYRDDGAGYGTTAKNISEDATSPDASYRSKDLHTNTIFNNYAGNDYTLNSSGDATNLAIADDGEDLSGTFTDDIIGQTRSTWYIGASEIVAVGGADVRKQIIQAYMRMRT